MRNKPEPAKMNNEIPQDTLRNSAAKVNVNDLLRRVRVEQKKEKKGKAWILEPPRQPQFPQNEARKAKKQTTVLFFSVLPIVLTTRLLLKSGFDSSL